jgi:pSer/pThr/pTyr-binding forkhead associated (FHA) protein
MKLVFPGGEHPQVLLGPGVNRIGSDPAATIVLDRPGVLPQHCRLHVTAHGVMLDVAQGTTVRVNGRDVDGLIALRQGDRVAFDRIEARLAAIEAPVALRHHHGKTGKLPEPANDDPGATAVRPVLPRYVLRGVSGEAFGRSFPLHGMTTVGRAPECGVRLDQPGLSRLHARLCPTDLGVQLEDLGSTNGTTINDRRVLRGEARAGDEIGFDTMRFRLVVPGQCMHGQTEQVPAVRMPDAAAAVRMAWRWVWIAAAALAAVWPVALLR